MSCQACSAGMLFEGFENAPAKPTSPYSCQTPNSDGCMFTAQGEYVCNLKKPVANPQQPNAPTLNFMTRP